MWLKHLLVEFEYEIVNKMFISECEIQNIRKRSKHLNIFRIKWKTKKHPVVEQLKYSEKTASLYTMWTRAIISEMWKNRYNLIYVLSGTTKLDSFRTVKQKLKIHICTNQNQIHNTYDVF